MQEQLARAARILLTSLVIFFLACAAYRSLRLAVADSLYRSDRVEALERAVHLDAGNARLHGWRAELEERAGMDSSAALRTATALDPLEASWWIRRGLRAEIAGDARGAEAALLEAARVSRQFEPRWALVNFYFRRGDEKQFWRWTRAALEMSYDDVTPVFRLCWRMAGSADEVLRVLPARAEPRKKYVAFLLADGRLDAVAPVAPLVSDRAVLLEACDRLLSSDRTEAAVAVWNSLCMRRIVGYAPLDPGRGVVVTNGDFGVPPSGSGFDWRVVPHPQISVSYGDGVKFSLSGSQPESCELLWQFLPVARGYSVRSECVGTSADTARTSACATWGITWRMEGNRLALVCSRLPGRTRFEGTVTLRRVWLEPAP